jgi:GGDEF domain-containing protein
MEKFIIGFWGCYFGTIGLMVAGCVFGFVKSLHRVAANAALTALASAFFTVVFLGGLPIEEGATLARFQAHVAAAVSALLLSLFFVMLGLFREARTWRHPGWWLAALTLATVAAGWLVPPPQALLLGLAQAGLLGLVALGLSLRSAWRRERLARTAVVGVFFMLITVAGLGWISLDRDHVVPWQVHAASALAGTIYLATTASALWARYAYLIELRQAMEHGPDYDMLTRMRSYAQTGPMVTDAFKRYRKKNRPLGMMIISIANLYALEKLYGQAAVNHVLFVCAGRLRRVVPADIEMGRLARDSFLLLLPGCRDSGQLIRLAHKVQASLARSVMLHTSFDIASLDGAATQQTRWAAHLGVGLLRVSGADARAAQSVALARGISRCAWASPSRVAWYDERSGEIVAMPRLAA